MAAAPPAHVRSEVYLWSSVHGMQSFMELNRPYSPYVRPGTFVADPEYYFVSQADLANEMGVDGWVFNIPYEKGPRGEPDSDLYRLEGRLQMLRSGNPHPANAAKIMAGLREMRRRFNGRIILNCGCPDNRDIAMFRDEKWMDGYVKVSLGPYLDSGVIDYLIYDSCGSRGGLLNEARVIQAVRRLYPHIPDGTEHHPTRNVGYIHNFECSLTTITMLNGTNVFRGNSGPMPYYEPELMSGPLVVAYNVVVPNHLEDALAKVQDSRCVAILGEHVGYGVRVNGQIVPPTDEQAATWREFMRRARIGNDGAVENPDPSTPATPASA